MSAMPPIATKELQRRDLTRWANKRHALTGKTPSAHGKSSRAKGSNIGI